MKNAKLFCRFRVSSLRIAAGTTTWSSGGETRLLSSFTMVGDLCIQRCLRVICLLYHTFGVDAIASVFVWYLDLYLRYRLLIFNIVNYCQDIARFLFFVLLLGKTKISARYFIFQFNKLSCRRDFPSCQVIPFCRNSKLSL